MGTRAETEVKRVIFVERVPKASVQWNISDEEVWEALHVLADLVQSLYGLGDFFIEEETIC
jgi:hypothetical protein